MFAEGMATQPPSTEEGPAGPLTPEQAAEQVLAEVHPGESVRSAISDYQGAFEDILAPDKLALLAVVAANPDGRLAPAALPVLQAVQLLARWRSLSPTALVLVPAEEEVQRLVVGHIRSCFDGDLVLLATAAGEAGLHLAEVKSQLLIESWLPELPVPEWLVGEPWAESAFATLGRGREPAGRLLLRTRRLAVEDNRLTVETSRLRGQLRVRQSLTAETAGPCLISLTADANIGMVSPAAAASPSAPAVRVQRWSPRLERFYGRGELQRLLDEIKQDAGLVRLADAEVIIDVGYGVGNRDGYEAVIEPLERALRQLGVRSLMIGGSRKVTEELHLLPADRQIGQSGDSVNPRLLLAIGISGAPQHLNYIGPRATIVAFNRDPEAPLLTLNQRQARPKVFPVIGDLFETVPAFVAALQAESGAALASR
jgi:hypothetical protein